MLKVLSRAFLVVNGARNLFIFFGQNTRWTLKPLYLDQIKLFNKSKSILTYNFFNAVLLLTRNQAPFYRLCIKFWHFIHFLAPRRGLFARCLAGWNFLLGFFFLGCGFKVVPPLWVGTKSAKSQKNIWNLKPSYLSCIDELEALQRDTESYVHVWSYDKKYYASCIIFNFNFNIKTDNVKNISRFEWHPRTRVKPYLEPSGCFGCVH